MKKNVSLVVALVFSVAIVGGALYYKFTAPTAKPVPLTTLSGEERAALRANVADTSSLDSDGDGLKDWEEALRGTDPSVADTDGDKTKDGDEVTAGRDPRVPGPNDEVAVLAEAEGPYRAPEHLSRTEIIGRELFAAYAELGNAKAFGSSRETLVLNDIIDRNISLPAEPKYSASDLTKASGFDSAAIATYKTQVMTELKRGEAVTEYELITLAKLIEKNNLSSKDVLATNAVLYKDIAQALTKIPTPQLLAPTHLSIMNALVDLASAQEFASENYTDPTDLLLALERFTGAEKALEKAMGDFRILTK